MNGILSKFVRIYLSQAMIKNIDQRKNLKFRELVLNQNKKGAQRLPNDSHQTIIWKQEDKLKFFEFIIRQLHTAALYFEDLGHSVFWLSENLLEFFIRIKYCILLSVYFKAYFQHLRVAFTAYYEWSGSDHTRYFEEYL